MKLPDTLLEVEDPLVNGLLVWGCRIFGRVFRQDSRQDIADIGSSRPMPAGVGCGTFYCLVFLTFEPLYTVDKTDLQLMHHDFDGVKVLPAVKAAGQIVPVIDGSIKSVTKWTGKTKFTVRVMGGKRQKFTDYL